MVNRKNSKSIPRQTPSPFFSALKVYRLLRGLRQSDLSRLSSVSQYSISALERGALRPTAEVRRRLALALGVDEQMLFTEEL